MASFEASSTAKVPVAAFQDFLVAVNPALDGLPCELLQNSLHEAEQVRVLDFLFRSEHPVDHPSLHRKPESNASSSDADAPTKPPLHGYYERVLAFNNSSMAFSHDIIMGVFDWHSECHHVDLDDVFDLVEERREQQALNERQAIFKISVENTGSVLSPHNRTNMRARHLIGSECTCNAHPSGTLAFITSEYKYIYKTFLCLCNIFRNKPYSFEGPQNLTVATCHANMPVLSTIPKHPEEKHFDPILAARFPSFINHLMMMKNILGCHKNGLVRWLDAYVTPDLTAVTFPSRPSNRTQTLCSAIDITTNIWTPARDAQPFQFKFNAVSFLAQDVRAAFEPDAPTPIRAYKILKAVQWRLLLLSIQPDRRHLVEEASKLTELTTDITVRLSEDDSGKFLESNSNEEWVRWFLYLLNPLFSKHLYCRGKLPNCSELVSACISMFMYAIYGCNPVSAQEALAALEVVAIREGLPSEHQIRGRNAWDYFMKGCIYEAISTTSRRDEGSEDDADSEEKYAGQVVAEHQGDDSAESFSGFVDIAKKRVRNCVTIAPPVKHLARVTMRKDYRSTVRFEILGAAYEAKVVLRRLVICKRDTSTRAHDFSYRLAPAATSAEDDGCGGTAATSIVPQRQGCRRGSLGKMRWVGRDKEGLSALANAMLSGEGGADAAGWLFRKILFGEVQVSQASTASYVPTSSKTDDAGAVVVEAELCGRVCLGQSVWLFSNALVVPTEDDTDDLFVENVGLMSFQVRFVSREEGRRLLEDPGRVLQRGMVASFLPLC